MNARSRVAVALDVPDLAAARALVSVLRGRVGVFKVGLELFTAAGPDALRLVRDAGAECFLDLKIHDIPATMARAVDAAAHHGVRYLTLHATSGGEGLARAAGAARGSGLQLLAVTVLTSLDEAQLRGIGLAATPQTAALRLADVARGAGIDGFVTSARECASLRARLGSDVLLVVPGIRPAGADDHDQKRVATPSGAVRAGADLLVVGRPVRDAADPAAAADAIVDEVAQAQAAIDSAASP